MTDQPQISTLTFNSVMIGSAQPKVLGEFYEKVFGRPADMTAEDGWYMWKAGSDFHIGEHSEVKGQAKEPARMILNFVTKEVKAEFERLKKLNVTVIKEPYEMGGGWIATLADPDGNFVQLVTPWEG